MPLDASYLYCFVVVVVVVVVVVACFGEECNKYLLWHYNFVYTRMNVL